MILNKYAVLIKKWVDYFTPFIDSPLLFVDSLTQSVVFIHLPVVLITLIVVFIHFLVDVFILSVVSLTAFVDLCLTIVDLPGYCVDSFNPSIVWLLLAVVFVFSIYISIPAFLVHFFILAEADIGSIDHACAKIKDTPALLLKEGLNFGASGLNFFNRQCKIYNKASSL